MDIVFAYCISFESKSLNGVTTHSNDILSAIPFLKATACYPNCIQFVPAARRIEYQRILEIGFGTCTLPVSDQLGGNERQSDGSPVPDCQTLWVASAPGWLIRPFCIVMWLEGSDSHGPGKSLASRLKRDVARQEVMLGQLDTLASGRFPDYCREKGKAELSKRRAEFEVALRQIEDVNAEVAAVQKYAEELYGSFE